MMKEKSKAGNDEAIWVKICWMTNRLIIHHVIKAFDDFMCIQLVSTAAVRRTSSSASRSAYLGDDDCSLGGCDVPI